MGYRGATLLPRGVIAGHDLSLFGGPIAHWSGNGTLVETITGGLGYDIGQTEPGYVPMNPLYSNSISALETKGRTPVVPSLNASLKLTGDTTVAGWFCVSGETIGAFPQLFSAHRAGVTSAENVFWGLRINPVTIKFEGFWHSGARVDQFTSATDVLEQYRWYHLAMTRGNSSDRCRLYIDGRLDSETTGLSAHTDGSNIDQITIGHDNAGAATHICLASVSLYNQELTPAQVSQLYMSSIESV